MALGDPVREFGARRDERAPARGGIEEEEVLFAARLDREQALRDPARDLRPYRRAELAPHRREVGAEEIARLERLDARAGRHAVETGDEIGERACELALEAKRLGALLAAGPDRRLAHGPSAHERGDSRDLSGAQKSLTAGEPPGHESRRDLGPGLVVERRDGAEGAPERLSIVVDGHPGSTYHATSTIDAGTPLAVHRTGAGERTIVLLHANPGDAHDYDAIVPALAERATVLAIDWPGYGASPAPADPSLATATGFARVLRRAAAALELRGADFVACSVGGRAALGLALDDPDRVRRLALVAPGGFTAHGLASRSFCRAMGVPAISSRLAGRLARRYLLTRNEITRAMIERADAISGDPARASVHASVWRSFTDPEHDLVARASAIACPVLLAWGARDPILPSHTDGARAAATIPGARFASFETGHAPFAEDPSAFLAELLPFLA